MRRAVRQRGRALVWRPALWSGELSGTDGRVPLARSRREYHRRGLAWLIGLSVLLHLTVLALLLLLPRPKTLPEHEGPPAISMVFEGGQPPPGPPAPGVSTPPPAPTPLVPPTPNAVPAPPPPMAPPAPALPAQPLTPPQPTPPTIAPPKAQVAPPPRVETGPLPLPPPLPQPQVPAPPAQAPAPHKTAPLPAPLMRNWSLGMPPGESNPDRRSRGLDLTLGPKAGGGLKSESEPDYRGPNLGSDWMGALRAWVNERKYYPEQAAMNGDQGVSVVRVVMERDGTVKSVTLERPSGSVFLDQAWVGLFRGARLPALPPTESESEVTFHFSMHYILLR